WRRARSRRAFGAPTSPLVQPPSGDTPVKRLGSIAAVALLALPGLAGSAQAARRGTGYTLSNSPAGNSVLEYSPAAVGSLAQTGAYATNGAGAGAGLGSQGALTVTPDHQFLLAVNAASNSVSAFAFGTHGLRLLNTVDSNGLTPISVTAHDHVVYVL